MINSEPPHVLHVRKVGESWDPTTRTPTNWEDWEIYHREDCPRRTEHLKDGTPVIYYECSVGFEAENVEPRWSLHYSGTPVEDTGYYLITTWHETFHGFDYTEHDGGICLYEPGN